MLAFQVTVECDALAFAAEVPGRITAKVDSLFPGHVDIQWSRWRGNYRADFIYQERNISVTFSRDGELIRSLEEIDFSLLPERIRESVTSEYGLYKVVMVLKYQRGKKIDYEVEIIKGHYHYVLSYNAKGFLEHQYDVVKTDLININ